MRASARIRPSAIRRRTESSASASLRSTMRRCAKPDFRFPRASTRRCSTISKPPARKPSSSTSNFSNRVNDPAQDRAFAAALRQMPSVLAYPLNTTTAGQIGEQRPIPELAKRCGVDRFQRHRHARRLSHRPADGNRHVGRRHARQRTPLLACRRRRGDPRRASARRRNDSNRRCGPHASAAAPDCRAPRSRHRRRKCLRKRSQDAAPIALGDAFAESPADLRPFADGALIFVGATAQGLGDFATTAGRGRIPGLFVNARFADQLMRGLLRAAGSGCAQPDARAPAAAAGRTALHAHAHDARDRTFGWRRPASMRTSISGFSSSISIGSI